ncbi:MAG: hypothetical protein AAF755_05835 [Pseudomonadota bacterium]
MLRFSDLLKTTCTALAIALTVGAAAISEIRAQTREPAAITEAAAEAFFRTWLGMIDAKAPVEQYLKYLPDGEFEQWSYTNAEIKNVAELRAYVEAAWGSIKQNTNVVKRIETVTEESGRVRIVADVDWTAVTADDQTINMPLTYTLTVGSGASSNDAEGAHPKILRYAIRPAQ